jgi:hypothetical protein
MNPNAIPILENNLDNVDWSYLSFNPSIFYREIDEFCFNKEFKTEKNLGRDLTQELNNPYRTNDVTMLNDRLYYNDYEGMNDWEPEHTKEDIQKYHERYLKKAGKRKTKRVHGGKRKKMKTTKKYIKNKKYKNKSKKKN